MEISWINSGKTLVVRVGGRLDITRSEAFEESVIKKFDEQNKDLVVNLSHVTYMSSSGIGALLAVYRHIGAKGNGMCICEVSPVVKKLLDVVEIGQIFNIYDREDDAIASFGKK